MGEEDDSKGPGLLPLMCVADAPAWSEATLVRRCLAGERLAWRHLHRRYYPVARAFLARLGVGAGELDDACQEVFLHLFRSLAGFRGEAELKTWLYRLCVTVAGRTRRRGGLTRRLLALVARERTEPALHALDGDAAVASRLLERGLQPLKPRARAVFVMYELEGLSGKEIAAVIGSPEATVYRLLHYARQSFRAALAEGGSS